MNSSVITLAGVGLLVGAANAASVNIDFEGSAVGGDVTHVGDDGALSSPGGTFWNGILVGTDVFDLDDEFGNPSDIDVLTGNTSGGTDAIANDLQDSGIADSFLIVGLDPNATYTLAVYTATFGGFILGDANGDTDWFFADPGPDASLPGDEIVGSVGDYFLIDNVQAKDLGAGVFGLEFTLDGMVTGIQIVPTPGAATAFGVLALAGVRRRRS